MNGELHVFYVIPLRDINYVTPRYPGEELGSAERYE